MTLEERGGSMYEASQQKTIITEYLEEVQKKRVWKVEKGTQGIQCSPFGVIPKKGKPGRWRLIVNLSAPDGKSVNDGIDKGLSSVAYTSVDDVVRRVLEGAKLAKADVKAAYRNIPVHLRDRWLLGMKRGGELFVDGALPFGLRSAPLLFMAVGDAIEWIATQRGARWLRHYIDDYVAVGQRGTDECERAMEILKQTCQGLGMPLDENKEEGPSEVLTFLGTELDTVAMEVRLPKEKLDEMRELLGKWRGMKSCRRDLESLVGSLNHACKAVRPGRAFKRRLQDLMTTVKGGGRRVRLNAEARADIEWWHQVGLEWNGTTLMKAVVSAEVPQEEMLSDASGHWGCGATWRGKWFQLKWETMPVTTEWSIMPKELPPIVVAAVVWGKHWKGLTIKARCDNMSVVAVVQSGACKEKWAMHLLRCLAFIETKGVLTIKTEHIKGTENIVADALSRDRLNSALSIMQVAEAEPTAIPTDLLEMLTTPDHSWSRQEWQRMSRMLSTYH